MRPQSIKDKAMEQLDDEFVKLLNLGHELLHSIMPFILCKVNRVSFGLLSPAEIKKAYPS